MSERPTKTPRVIIGNAIYVSSAVMDESGKRCPPEICKNSKIVPCPAYIKNVMAVIFVLNDFILKESYKYHNEKADTIKDNM